MSWNYRVVSEDGNLRIRDVYYDEAGAPVATHVDPTYVYGETIADLRTQLELMAEALEMPVLESHAIGSDQRSRDTSPSFPSNPSPDPSP